MRPRLAGGHSRWPAAQWRWHCWRRSGWHRSPAQAASPRTEARSSSRPPTPTPSLSRRIAHAAPTNLWDCIGVTHQQWRAEQLPGGADQLIAVHSGLCLDVIFGHTSDGAQVGQANCSGGPAQRWRLLPADNGRYQVIAEHSDLCLAVAYNRVGNGETIIQENCDYGQLDERWLFTPVG